MLCPIKAIFKQYPQQEDYKNKKNVEKPDSKLSMNIVNGLNNFFLRNI